MMSRLRKSSPLWIGLLFLLSACHSSSTPPTVEGFRCEAVISTPELTVEGTLTRLSAGLLTFDIQNPESLRDVSLQWDGETVSLKLHGLTFGVDPSKLPASGIGQAVLAALDAAVGSQGEHTSSGLLVGGLSSSGEFSLISDPETGALLSLSIPSIGLQAKFSDFSHFSAD